MPQKLKKSLTQQNQSSDRPLVGNGTSDGIGDFTRRCFIAVAVASFAFLLWQLRHVVVIAFAAIVVAVLLVAAASPIRRLVPIGHGLSVATAGVILILIAGLIGSIAWPPMREQSAELIQRIPEAMETLEDRTGIAIEDSLTRLASEEGMFGRVWQDAMSMAGTVASALTGIVLVLVTGAFLAAAPALYREGLVLLVPPAHHQHARTALDRTGRGLKLWLLGQLISMVIVGILVGLGSWLIGLPSPLALGLVAFLAEFLPLIGPFLGAIPGLLLASTQDWDTLFWTVLMYLAVQQLESNVVTPLVQRKAVRVPPALFLLSVLAMGVLFGIIGILLSGPLTVAVYVLVRALYVEGTLGESVHRPRGV
jgi:predicted PurR-regulated permease PerM